MSNGLKRPPSVDAQLPDATIGDLPRMATPPATAPPAATRPAAAPPAATQPAAGQSVSDIVARQAQGTQQLQQATQQGAQQARQLTPEQIKQIRADIAAQQGAQDDILQMYLRTDLTRPQDVSQGTMTVKPPKESGAPKE